MYLLGYAIAQPAFSSIMPCILATLLALPVVRAKVIKPCVDKAQQKRQAEAAAQKAARLDVSDRDDVKRRFADLMEYNGITFSQRTPE